MGEAERRQLANFEIEAKPRKKSTGSAAKSGGAASSRASAGKKAASGNKPAAKKTAAKPATKKASSAAKPVAKKAASNGTKAAAAASKPRMKNQTNEAKKKNTRTRVEENPLARRSSAALEVEIPARRAPSRSAMATPAKPVKKPSAPVYSRDSYDEYDLPPKPRRKKGGRKRRRKSFDGVSLLLLLIVVGIVGFGAWRVQEYKAFAEMKAVVSRQTFYQGTTVEGMDVSNMTLPQALEYWRDQVEPKYTQRAAVLNDGTQVTAAQLGYESDYGQVISSAWNAGRSGSLKERYRNLQSAVAQPRAYEVDRQLYDDAVVQEYVASVAEQVDQEPKNARLKSFNTDSSTFEFEAEQNGYTLNQTALAGGIKGALDAGGGNVQMQIETIAPAVTLENVSSQYGMIASAVTNASSSNKNRLSNIQLSLSMINGMKLEPGETFSFNEVVGKRTKDRGFKVATAYSGGKVTEEVGGGICQVSTTLFNAAVKADLKINERHPHSLTVSYVDLGKDAAVDWGNKDLKFTNNSDDAVYISCYLDEEKRVRIGIFGKLLPNGQSITVESQKTNTHDYETEYQMSFELFSGQTKKIQEGKKGYSAIAYKVWHDANGNEIRREELCKSRYQSTPEIIAYGP